MTSVNKNRKLQTDRMKTKIQIKHARPTISKSQLTTSQMKRISRKKKLITMDSSRQQLWRELRISSQHATSIMSRD